MTAVILHASETVSLTCGVEPSGGGTNAISAGSDFRVRSFGRGLKKELVG